MPVRLRPLPPDEVALLLGRLEVARLAGEPDRDDIRAAVKHFLAVLAARAPGRSVEVRVPPYAVVQCVEGARHTRGTPPAVVESDADSWLAMALGTATFAELSAAGRVRASGERSDLTTLLPLT
ncbi:MAG: sterol carrier family protein [Actinomycetota bacterium]|nr:sterol carrier family protein [Actinomycetota bacterium]